MGGRVWSPCKTAFYFGWGESRPYKHKYQRLAVGYGKWSAASVRDMFNALGHPCTKDVPTAVSALCRWPFVLQLAWPTAVNIMQYATHCQHTTARHITELLWQFISCSPSYSHCQKAVQNTSRISALLLQADPRWISENPPASPYSHSSVPQSF